MRMSLSGPIRLVAMTAALGIVIAYAISPGTATAIGGNDTASSAPAPTEASDYERGVEAVDDGRYRDAVDLMQKVVHEDPSNADAYNYLGFSHRKLGEYDSARTYYTKALDIEPGHLGALEYLGELYVETGEMSSAEQTLSRIENLCGRVCEEYRTLNDRIVSAQRN